MICFSVTGQGAAVSVSQMPNTTPVSSTQDFKMPPSPGTGAPTAWGYERVNFVTMSPVCGKPGQTEFIAAVPPADAVTLKEP